MLDNYLGVASSVLEAMDCLDQDLFALNLFIRDSLAGELQFLELMHLRVLLLTTCPFFITIAPSDRSGVLSGDRGDLGIISRDLKDFS